MKAATSLKPNGQGHKIDADTSNAEAESALGNDRPKIELTKFEFEHRVFQTPGARFLLKGTHHTPTFRVDMGDLDALIEIPVLKKEFNIMPDSHDGKLVDLAVAGLRYVPDIKPGDSIPSEILNGTASWTISPKHKKIAQQRLQVQLLSWVLGKEVLLTDPQEIEMFLDQLESREKLKVAFKDAAVALGHAPTETEIIVRQLELLARELCYIEALRDRFALIPELGEKLSVLRKSCGNDRNGKIELNRIYALLQTGVNEYSAIFAEADAQTGEIIAALKSIDRQVTYIRQIRDDLHFLLMQWEPQIRNLVNWHKRRTPETDKLLSSLYRFLAPRFTAGQSLLKKRSEKNQRPKQPNQRPAGGAPSISADPAQSAMPKPN